MKGRRYKHRASSPAGIKERLEDRIARFERVSGAPTEFHRPGSRNRRKNGR